MGYSFKLKIDKSYVRKDGNSAVYFQVIINRKKDRIGLNISWPASKFSLVDGCLPRSKDDQDAAVNNVVINDARNKANEIRKQYLLKGQFLTLEGFLREYKSDLNKNDFIAYMEKKSFNRWNERDISDETYSKEKVVLNHLKQFRDIIPFTDFTSKWANEWDKFLKKKFKNDDNTRWGKHKIVMTYLALARDEDKISFDDPYSRFNNQLVESSWGPLELSELQKLIEHYIEWKEQPLKILHKNGVHQEDNRQGFTYTEICILRKFLFACNTSLRISDLQKLDEDLFKDFNMSITPHKTERWGTKIDALPINDVAKMLLEDEISEVEKVRKATDKTLRIFERYVDQYCNRMLKRIAKKVGIEKNLHMHVARYTFGSIMDQAGANHTALMKLMGIRKRDTLEKYVKTNKAIIANDVAKMSAIVNLPALQDRS
jgi:integrase/recombinase XerD